MKRKENIYIYIYNTLWDGEHEGKLETISLVTKVSYICFSCTMIWCDDTAEQVILHEWECMCWMKLTWVDIICECGGGGGWGCWGDGCDEGCVGGDGRIVELFCNKQRKRQTCSNTAIQATARLEGLGMIVLILCRSEYLESYPEVVIRKMIRMIYISQSSVVQFVFFFFS